MRTYKRIAEIATSEERDALRRELADRFGPPPAAVDNLLDYAVLKSLCERLQISSVERRGSEVALKFHPTTPVRPERLVRLVRKQKGTRLDPSGVLTVTLAQGRQDASPSDPKRIASAGSRELKCRQERSRTMIEKHALRCGVGLLRWRCRRFLPARRQSRE